MRLALVDMKDQDVRRLIQVIAYICYSEEFKSLKQELEQLYGAAGVENPSVSAFQDTLYALLCQHEDMGNESAGLVSSCMH
ncbi:MAG: hypothetical protein AAGU23_09585 [Bacillota bacterium]|nr:hypothetical protein [Bacillota bacterium]